MRMLSILPLCLLAAVLAAGEAWQDLDFEPISAGIENPARIALRQEGANLLVALLVDRPAGAKAPPAVSLGLAAAGKVLLETKEAQAAVREGRDLFTFSLPAGRLATSEAEWATLRLGAGISVPGGPAGQPLYRVRYRHQDGRAVHAEFSGEAQDWRPFDLAGYRQRAADRRSRLLIAFDQPLNGKATIIIDDAQGRRVRNLVSGLPFAKGPQQAEWDLLDDDGKAVAPGDYTFRSLHHAGIAPEFQFSFCNDGNPPWKTGSGEDMWGPDHSCITSVAACGPRVYFLSPCAEAGYQGAVTDLDGVKRQTWGTPTPASHFLASDGSRVFVAADNGKRQVLLRCRPGKEWDITGGSREWENFPGGREIEWGKAEMNGFGKDEGFFSHADWNAFSLAGLAVAGGRVAIASRADKALLLFDAESGAKAGSIPLPEPGACAGLPDGSILAVSGGAILRVAPKAGAAVPLLAAGKLKPGAMAAGKDGKLYVVDEATSQIAILDATSGRETGRLGKPGGAYAGAYDPERMVRPMALAIADNGWLWVTENRFNPKRVLAWDLKSGKVVKEKFGSTVYGASGGGIDPADPTRMIGQGAIWKIDHAKRTAVPASILYVDADTMPSANHWRFLRHEGRTFLLGYHSCNSLVELLKDGSGRLLAQYGSAQGFCLGLGKRLPQCFLDTFYQACGFDTPEKRKGLHEGRLPHNRTCFVWSDRSGDGGMQADELEFAERLGSGYWGGDTERIDIIMQLFADLGGRPGNWRMELPLLGWHASGAPRWKPLADGQRDAVPTLPAHWGQQSALADRTGRLFLNADPQLLAYAPDGSLLWTYPNHWAGVHGSHDAPLPSPGQLQGTLFFLGNAPLDDGKNDVFILNGNHGRFFALTSDGFYLDEFFKDVRMGAEVDAYLIGGECFGGSFVRGADKRYYLLSGHTDHRIFTLRGFESIVRGAGGKVAVSVAQLDAALRRQQAAAVVASQPRRGSIPRLSAPPALDGSGNGWPGAPVAAWSKSGKFPAQVQAGWDAANLYLRWSVEDASPWSNHGADDKLLFKTGDSVDLQIGCDPAALANRTAPVPGDCRLLIAPFQGKPVAMLYRHRVAGATSPVPFSSPWRTENVDEVRRLEGAKINLVTGRALSGQGGYLVEAAIPLADLGLKPEPGREYRVDVGAIHGDPEGQMNQLRSYWSNQGTGLVNDVPGEIMLHPDAWGTVVFEGGKP